MRGFFTPLKTSLLPKNMYPQSNSLYFGIYFITHICELENERSLEKIRSIIYFIQASFHKGLKRVPFESLSPKKNFFSKLADFWYLGVFGLEKSIGACPE